MVKAAKPRRVPTQKRGEERVQQILDATADLVLEMGGDGITTNHIAKQAGVNVGTLYHFFTNKFEIFSALIVRAFVKLEARVEAAASEPASTAGEWMDRIVDAHDEVWLEEAAAIRLWETLRLRPELRATAEHYNELITSALLAGFKRYLPHIPAGRRRSLADVMRVTLTTVLDQANSLSERSQRRMLVRELRELLQGHLERRRRAARPRR